ncbi:hypothetical protein AQUCO_00200628v1 [Aquilegia coerulea]|uniref:MYB-CC type transcription factor LHEQLE-containing domain-containing protein n=1 Tax=Aquilegia coerulea TaxID=218851 RepID=A0A2G5F4A2_AQUCA|nr:hypothetical protein AQUCO_00200628v1 [Aquilegia coerulea]
MDSGASSTFHRSSNSARRSGKSNTKKSDEGDGYSWIDFVPSEESFTGIFLFFAQNSVSSIFAYEIFSFVKVNRCFLIQKYRLGKSQLSESCDDNEQEDNRENEIEGGHMNVKVNEKIHAQSDEGLHVTQALKMQIDVQNKLHEQIEVQRHLQLRIEAQGMYLQSILKKAQETLSGYNSSSTELEAAKTEVSELVSMVETGCLDSSFSEFTKTGCFVLDNEGKKLVRTTDCSLDSSLTSFESYGSVS